MNIARFYGIPVPYLPLTVKHKNHQRIQNGNTLIDLWKT
jgi:hypothetical protein